VTRPPPPLPPLPPPPRCSSPAASAFALAAVAVVASAAAAAAGLGRPTHAPPYGNLRRRPVGGGDGAVPWGGPGGGGEGQATVGAVTVTEGCSGLLVGRSGSVEQACCRGGILLGCYVTSHGVSWGYRKQQEGSVYDLSQNHHRSQHPL